MVLTFTNNVDKSVYNFDVTDNNLSQIFYNFNIVLPEGMPDGEYGYVLTDGDTGLATGLVQIGDYVPEKTEYTKDNNSFIQYKG